MNAGKIFEEQFKKSVPEYCYLLRLKDPPQSFEKTARFSRKNPFDFIMFDDKRKTLYALELKSTKGKSISIEGLNDDSKRMIHRHQILGLAELDKYENINAGFVLNFRDEDNERCFYIDINTVLHLLNDLSIKSISLKALTEIGIEIDTIKHRTKYTYDINKFLSEE